MKMTTYLGILALGILLASLAHADQPGQYPYPGQNPEPQYYPRQQPQPQYYPQQEPQYYPQQGCPQCAPRPTCVQCAPLPIEQFPPDQSFYCPPNVTMAPPVLPYPGPQVRVVRVPRAFGGSCNVQRAGNGMFVIVLNGRQMLYGPAVLMNVQAVLIGYQRNGVCQQVF